MAYSMLISMISHSVGVPGALLFAICSQESHLHNPFTPHDGGSPSYGVCQIKLDTAKSVGYKGNGKGLMQPETNIKWSAEYLKVLLHKHDDNWCKAAAAYNAGTFFESRHHKGRPTNMDYIRKVQEFLDPELRNKLSCELPVATEEVV